MMLLQIWHLFVFKNVILISQFQLIYLMDRVVMKLASHRLKSIEVLLS